MLIIALPSLSHANTPVVDARALVAPLGLDKLDQIGSLSFTFNVAKEGPARPGRAWMWQPATGRVTRTVDGNTLTFTLGAPSSDEERKADHQFINDSFWLAPQLHLRWGGDGLQVTDGGTVPRPIGEGTARRVTLQYDKAGGGYTPGDAYDLFLDEAGKIVAWHYREGGVAEPSMTTTFAEYVTVGPLELATDHRSADGTFRLFFTDLAVTPKLGTQPTP